jgi:hypothetical protein
VRSAVEILIVSDDPGLHRQLGPELEAKGMLVMDCSGPSAGEPCIGLRGLACPLRTGADLVVLDVHPDGSGYVDKSGRAGLVAFYNSGGKPVVVMVDEADATSDVQLAGVTTLSRLARVEAVVEAIQALARDSAKPSATQTHAIAGGSPISQASGSD